jgi:PAS domain S-box-containing protein
MRSKRTQKSSSIGTGKSVPNGREARDETTLLVGAENARREAERKYRDIFENAVEGIFQTTPAGGFLTVNPALAGMLGYESPEELIRERRDIALQGYVDPNGREEFQRLLETQDTVAGFEHQVYRKDRSKIWMSENVRAVRDASGKLLYYEGTIEDITDRKLAEEALRDAERKYHDIYENAVEGIFQIKPVGGYISANPALARMLGFDSTEELISELSDPAKLRYINPQRHDEYLRRLAEEGVLRDFEYQDYRKDGSTIWLSDNVRAVRDSEGTPLYYEGTTQDITSRKLAEHALRESEERYRDLVENSRELICTHDLDGLILSVNPAAAAAVGYDLDEFVGKRTVRDLLAPEVRHQFDEYMARLRKDGATSGIMLVKTSTGERRVWEYYNSLRSEGVATPIVRGMAQDVTERRRAEAALRESERKYRDLVETAHDLIWAVDAQGTITFMNQACRRIYGYEPEELIGRPYLDLLSPEERTRQSDTLPQLLASGEKFVLGSEVEVLDRDGNRHTLVANAVILFDKQGNAIGTMGTSADITERKRTEAALRDSEERYRELFENDKDAIYVHDLKGVYKSVNRAAERLSGYSREEILGKHFWDLVATEYVAEVRENLCGKLAETGETNYEVEIISKDGARVPVEVSSRLIYENGVAIGVQGSARDITERKRAREALLTYSRRLIAAQEAERGRIARELHDQIGQMLTALKLNLHAIQSARNQGEAGALIEDNLKMLDEALEHVRDLSVDVRPLLLDDLGLVAALRWYVDHQAQRAGVRAEFTCDSLDPDVRFSSELETACFRIAQEALTNVARHARAETVTVWLSRNRDYLILGIEDDGEGFDIEALQRHALAGATLGLRGMEERAYAVGGRVKIDSATNKGTRVFVELPIAMPNGGRPQP